jgi:hypothetical protein
MQDGEITVHEAASDSISRLRETRPAPPFQITVSA